MSSETACTVPPFLVRLDFLPGESVVSFVQRHCSANRAARMLHVLRLIEAVSGECAEDVRDIVYSKKALRAVEYLTGLAEGTLDSHHVRSLQGTHLVTGHHVWRKASHRPRRQAICPVCIQVQPYARVRWEFPHAPVCTEHAVAMLEACPSCTHPLRFSRRLLTHCEKCHFALKAATPEPVPHSALRVAELVQNPAMVAMGDQDSTAPIDAEDLADLLRLCLPPAPGRNSTYGLSGHPGDVPVVDRVRALERLGSAFDQRRIDSSRLRATVMERWPGFSFLPAEAQLEQLAEVALEMEMDGEVVRLLCFGDEDKRARRASDVFEGRPPQLKSEYEVADFLGLDVHALRTLQGRDELAKAEDDVGYDMDHVLALQNKLKAWSSPGDVDHALGMQGLAAELCELKLLTGLRAADGKLLGIQPQSFGLLMSRIQSAMEVGDGDTAFAVPLGQAAAYYMQPEHIAWVVSQVAGGSVAAYSWPHPQNLSFLRVDDRRLRTLVSQLNSGTSTCPERFV
jgi:hypothetical protein